MFVVARRLERNIKEMLDEIGETKERFETLLTGKRVLLAEELSELVLCQSFAKITDVTICCCCCLERVRQIHDLLEEFVQALHREKAT